jgi:hypothetical protein
LRSVHNDRRGGCGLARVAIGDYVRDFERRVADLVAKRLGYLIEFLTAVLAPLIGRVVLVSP